MKKLNLAIFFFIYCTAIFINIFYSNIIISLINIGNVFKFILFMAMLTPSMYLMYIEPNYTFKNLKIKISKKILLYIVIAILLGFFAYYLISYPEFKRPINLFGDEDFHIESTLNISKILHDLKFSQFTSNNVIHSVGRYPGLHHFLASIIGTKELYFRDAQLYLFFIFLAATLLVLLTSELNSNVAIFLTLFLFIFSPLNISYIENYYIDLLIPFLVFIALTALYSYYINKNIYWLIMALFAIAVTPFLRQHMLPTNILFTVAAVALVIKNFSTIHLKFLVSAVCILISIFPIALYLFIITKYFHSDESRLFLSNIIHQDFSILILFLPIYIPSIIFLKVKFDRVNLIYLAILASLAAQLLLYSMFEPGWMPWSRNYLSFVGQIIFLAVYLNSKDNFKLFIHRNFLLIIYLLIIFSSCLIYTKKNNFLFSENENRMRYDYVLDFIAKNYPPNEKIFFQTPVKVPASLNSILSDNPSNAAFERNRLIPIHTEPNSALGDPYLFLNTLDCSADLAIIHWRQPRSFAISINHLPFEKFNPNTNIPFKIVYEYSDPIHDGMAGLMLVERKSKCSKN